MNFKVTTNILFRMTPVLTVRTQMLFLLVTSAYMLHQYNMKIYSSANNQDYRWKVGEENDYILQTVGNRRVTYKKGPVLQVNWMAVFMYLNIFTRCHFHQSRCHYSWSSYWSSIMPRLLLLLSHQYNNPSRYITHKQIRRLIIFILINYLIANILLWMCRRIP